MGVKVVIVDLDGTLIDDRNQAVPGTVEMTAELKSAGLNIVVATNRRGEFETKQLLNNAGITYDIVEDRPFANNRPKGAPEWVGEICKYLRVQTNEIVYLGDSALDMRTAVNGRVIYFHAAWSNIYPYGLAMTHPKLFSLIVRECFINPSGWYWQLQTRDDCGRVVDTRALMDSYGAGITVFQSDMLHFLKDGQNPTVGPMTVGDFLTYHLLGNLYADSIFNLIDTWAVYPSSSPTKSNHILSDVAVQIARLFRDRNIPVLVRHNEATDSGEARRRRETVGFDNQVNTVQLDPSYKTTVTGRTVAVLDDFMTEGYSMECARNLFLHEGASNVIGINFSKYSGWPKVATPQNDYVWDGYAPTTHDTNAFRLSSHSGSANSAALAALKASYQRVSVATI